MFLEEDLNKLLALKNTLPPDTDAVSMHYHLAKDEYGNVTSSLRRNRLVKRTRGFRWIGAVHEYLEVIGLPIAADIAVTHASLRHDSDRNSAHLRTPSRTGRNLRPAGPVLLRQRVERPCPLRAGDRLLQPVPADWRGLGGGQHRRLREDIGLLARWREGSDAGIRAAVLQVRKPEAGCLLPHRVLASAAGPLRDGGLLVRSGGERAEARIKPGRCKTCPARRGCPSAALRLLRQARRLRESVRA